MQIKPLRCGRAILGQVAFWLRENNSLQSSISFFLFCWQFWEFNRIFFLMFRFLQGQKKIIFLWFLHMWQDGMLARQFAERFCCLWVRGRPWTSPWKIIIELESEGEETTGWGQLGKCRGYPGVVDLWITMISRVNLSVTVGRFFCNADWCKHV